MIFEPLERTTADFKVEDVIANASLAEKVSLLAGNITAVSSREFLTAKRLAPGLDFWHTTPLPRHGVPSIRQSDGPCESLYPSTRTQSLSGTRC